MIELLITIIAYLLFRAAVSWACQHLVASLNAWEERKP